MTLSRKSTDRYAIEKSALYKLPTMRALATSLLWEGTPSALRALSKRVDNFTEFEQINAVNKKKRTVQAPRKCTIERERQACAGCFRTSKRGGEASASRPRTNRCIKSLQKRLNVLLKQISVPDYLHSGIPGRSHFSNSKAHLDADGATATVDISNFYPSIRRGRLYRLFSEVFACEKDVAEVMADLVCFNGHLATGCPASALLSFYACKGMFDKIEARARRHDAVFTLYIDDIALTGKAIGHGDVKYLSNLLARYGFKSQAAKARVFKKEGAKVVTGRAFRNGVSRAPNRSHEKMHETLNEIRSDRESLKTKRSAIGRLEYVGMLDERRSERFKEEAQKIRDTLPRKKPQLRK